MPWWSILIGNRNKVAVNWFKMYIENRLNFEKFRWNFSSSTYPEIERSELYQVNVKLKLNVIFIVEKQCFV